MIARAGALALACTTLLLAPAPAGATNVTAAGLRALAAHAAAGDPGALADLRAVTSVNGEPARVADTLDVVDPSALRYRLRALATSGHGAGPIPDPAQAQAAAAAVLQQRQYGRAPLPDPIGTVLRKVGHFIGRLAARAPGGPVVFWLIVAAILLVGATFGAGRMMRRLEAGARSAPRDGEQAAEDPRALERAADAAEARQAFAEAIRLRFQAGLLTLGERGRLAYRPSLLTGEASRELSSEAFDELAAGFERVAYAQTPADERQATAARDGWGAVLADAQARR
jgi:hypothetical protein